MRPIRLVMSAFGPYKDRIEIDFEKLGSNGIFLITGDTGSGKTTIFDAISFALFGVSSGSRRENSSLRSDFAKDDVKTYVELDFLHKGVLYKIERLPRYTRTKLRGNGTTSVGGDATLVYLDEIITGDKNVSDKCIEILGINSNQFRQIVMIAQGEFMELLHAKPRDRAVIFRKIFDTGIYKDISDRLKDKYLSKRREYEDVIIALNSYKKNIIWEEEVDDDISVSSLLDLLSDYNEKVKCDENSLSLLKKELDKEYELIMKDINEGKLINDSIVSLENLKNELDELNNKKDIYKEKEKNVKENKEIIEVVIPKKNEVFRLKQKLDEKKKEYYDNLSLKEKIDIKYEDILLKYKDISKLESKLDSLNKEKDIYDKKLISWQEVKELEVKLKEKENILRLINLENKKDILGKFGELDKFNKLLEEKELEFKELSLKYKEFNNNYVNAYEEFLSAQAGVLASNLKDNCPCPVCGSIDHPKKASLCSSVLTKEEIDNLKVELESISKGLEELSIFINGLKKDIVIYDNELKNYNYNDILGEIDKLKEDIIDYDIDIEVYDKVAIEKEIISISSLYEDKYNDIKMIDSIDIITYKVNELFREIENVNNSIKEINNVYSEVCIEKEKYNTLVITLEKDYNTLEKEYVLFNDEYIKSYKDLGYENEKDYLSLMVDKKVLVELEEDISLYNLRLVEVKSGINSLEKFLKNKNKIDVLELEEKKIILEDEINDKNVSLKEINNKLFNNLSIYDNIKSVYDKSIEIEKEVMVYKDLSDTANGNISGKNKLEFEQYVQANYFDLVIGSANKRFSYMTDDRFLLARKEEALKVSDKLGLELEVVDNYTGKRRDVKTLSGGESFKAALSLALGMSDVIQEFAGGIVVDAMFIDEGFGSLDDTSLESAMNAIMMLGSNDKIIGIISHVNELKSRIDKKIVVSKSSSGSSVSIVI